VLILCLKTSLFLKFKRIQNTPLAHSPLPAAITPLF
jgi:hypothetical protein